ncbi:MAG: DNA polymerase III subunit beta [Candidatus Omnitrophica bacterium]|nr:DNA polymerase III subunit beta [Candidatus Omnitrophota bacterium]
MWIKIKKQNLISGIQKIQGVITTKSTLPILSYILLQTQQESIILSATDLDIGIIVNLTTEVTESGGISVPAKRFSDIIRELPIEDVEITTKKNNTLIIKTDFCEFKITGLPKEEFPKLPEFKNKEVIILEQGILKEMLELTSFAVSTEETRYILNGILFEIKNNSLNVVATDGRRLAIAKRKLTNPINKEIKIIIPIKAIHELNRNLEEGKQLKLILDKNQVMFELDGLTIISRLIEGEFPDYQQVIPAVSNCKMLISREAFLGGIRRANLLATPDYQAVKLELTKNKLVISKFTPDIGELREEVGIDYTGKDLVIGFNPDFLIDVLKVLKDEKVEIEFTESEKPAVIRKPDYLYIVLPMRLS